MLFRLFFRQRAGFTVWPGTYCLVLNLPTADRLPARLRRTSHNVRLRIEAPHQSVLIPFPRLTRVFHTVLCCRVVLHIRRAMHEDTHPETVLDTVSRVEFRNPPSETELGRDP